MSVPPSPKEAVGDHYSLEDIQFAQRMTWRAIEQIASRIQPGMLESEARALGQQVLADLDTQRIWHPLLVRFGSNTLKTFKQRSEGDPRLGEDDIFFIDMGAVWRGHEGDAGATFTTGDDAQMKDGANAARTLFDRVHRHWRETGVSGQALYDFAGQQARQLGWRLNLHIRGHRVSDFPHAIHRGGDLGDFSARPTPGLWILEIQIAHPSRPFGAFYEDLLV